MKNEKSKVYYWHGIVGDQSIVDQCPELINQLLSGDYEGADLDIKHAGGNNKIYSAKINDAKRLLFTTIEEDGKSYILLLETTGESHKYRKARCMDDKVLRDLLEKHGNDNKPYEFSALNDHEMAKLAAKLQADEAAQVARIPVQFYKQRLIVINALQQTALHADNQPLMMFGPPGSGKTCVAMELIKKFAQPLDDQPKEIVYLTESKYLQREMKENWESLPESVDNPHTIHFWDYERFLRHSDATAEQLNGLTVVKRPRFDEWLTDNIRTFKKICHTQIKIPEAEKTDIDISPIDSIFKDSDKVYQALQIIGAYPRELNILRTLGKNEFPYESISEKEILLKLYETYLRALEEQRLIDLTLTTFALTPEQRTNYRVVCDEAADLSISQLSVTADLAAATELPDQQVEAHVAFCFDNRQSLKNSLSISSFLRKKFQGAHVKPISEIRLKTAYRCSKPVVDFANKFSSIALSITGVTDKQDYTEIESATNTEAEGESVAWYENTDEIPKNYGQSANYAVIARAEDVAEAQKICGTSLVFTIDQIKGLEFDYVLIYKGLNPQLLAQASQSLARNTDKKTGRSKEGVFASKAVTEFNAFFTAITRARKKVMIYQPPDHRIQPLINEIKPTVSATLPTESAPNPSTKAEWINKGRELLKDEETAEQGRDLLEEHLGAGWRQIIGIPKPSDSTAVVSTEPKPVSSSRPRKETTVVQPVALNINRDVPSEEEVEIDSKSAESYLLELVKEHLMTNAAEITKIRDSRENKDIFSRKNFSFSSNTKTLYYSHKDYSIISLNYRKKVPLADLIFRIHKHGPSILEENILQPCLDMVISIYELQLNFDGFLIKKLDEMRIKNPSSFEEQFNVLTMNLNTLISSMTQLLGYFKGSPNEVKGKSDTIKKHVGQLISDYESLQQTVLSNVLPSQEHLFDNVVETPNNNTQDAMKERLIKQAGNLNDGCFTPTKVIAEKVLLNAIRALPQGTLFVSPEWISTEMLEKIIRILPKRCGFKPDELMPLTDLKRVVSQLPKGRCYMPNPTFNLKTLAHGINALPKGCYFTPHESMGVEIGELMGVLPEECFFTPHFATPPHILNLAAKEFGPNRYFSPDPRTDKNALIEAIKSLGNGVGFRIFAPSKSFPIKLLEEATAALPVSCFLRPDPDMSGEKLKSAVKQLTITRSFAPSKDTKPKTLIEAVDLLSEHCLFRPPAGINIEVLKQSVAALSRDGYLTVGADVTVNELKAITGALPNGCNFLPDGDISKDMFEFIIPLLGDECIVRPHDDAELDALKAIAAAIRPGCYLFINRNFNEAKACAMAEKLVVNGRIATESKASVKLLLAIAKAMPVKSKLYLSEFTPAKTVTKLAEELSKGENFTTDRREAAMKRLEEVVSMLPQGSAFQYSSGIPNEALTAAVKKLPEGRIFIPNPESSKDALVAAAGALPKGSNITLHPKLARELAKATATIAALPENCTYIPNLDTPQELLEAATTALPKSCIFFPNHRISKDILVAAIRTLAFGSYFTPHQDMPQELLKAAIAALPARSMFRPIFTTTNEKILVAAIKKLPKTCYFIAPPSLTEEQLVKAVGNLSSGCYFMPDAATKIDFILEAIKAMSEGCRFLLNSQTPSDIIIRLARTLSQGKCFTDDPQAAEDVLVAVVSRFPPSTYFYPSFDTPVNVLEAAIKVLPIRCILVPHPKTPKVHFTTALAALPKGVLFMPDPATPKDILVAVTRCLAPRSLLISHPDTSPELLKAVVGALPRNTSFSPWATIPEDELLAAVRALPETCHFMPPLKLAEKLLVKAVKNLPPGCYLRPSRDTPTNILLNAIKALPKGCHLQFARNIESNSLAALTSDEVLLASVEALPVGCYFSPSHDIEENTFVEAMEKLPVGCFVTFTDETPDDVVQKLVNLWADKSRFITRDKDTSEKAPTGAGKSSLFQLNPPDQGAEQPVNHSPAAPGNS